MKHFSTPSIDTTMRYTMRFSFIAYALACVMPLLFSCTSDAAIPSGTPSVGGDDDISTSSFALEESSEAARVSIGFQYLAPPPPGPSFSALVDPIPPDLEAKARIQTPSDITVLSRQAGPEFQGLVLPEPRAPTIEKPAQSPLSLEGSKTLAAKPEPKPEPKAVAKPVPKTEAKDPVIAPSDAPSADSEPSVQEPLDTKPPIMLPATPTSSARSITPEKTQPLAETRLETTRGQRFELRFPGTGWIYLGDEDGKEGLKYETRRFEDSQAVFAMNPESPGEYLLRFQRQNPVDRSTEVSLVRVIVSDKKPVSPLAQVEPLASTAEPSKTAALTQDRASSTSSPSSPTTPSSTASSTSGPQAPQIHQGDSPTLPTEPAALIRLAKSELEGTRVQSALEALDRYLSLYPYGNDEIYYLYGLAYEQDTPFRNIKKAYEYYRRVRDEYPRSARWKESADRVAYLERHYFGLR